MLYKSLLSLGFIIFSFNLLAQEDKITIYQNEIRQLNEQIKKVETQLENARLVDIQDKLTLIGLPQGASNTTIVNHEALTLAYDEKHEQAAWVAHIISPAIVEGAVFRTNDFRADPLVKTKTAEEKDYFLKFLQPDSTYKYDGFGYDRGHLAPSADFRWSKKALSESYFYSNMSPQLPGFNREIWAKLENKMRAYIYRNPETPLYIVTGPILKEGLPVIERSVNKVSIPEQFWKVAIDPKNGRGIGFILPHQKTSYPLSSFAVSIDEVEKLTGLDFFSELEDKIENQLESQKDLSAWLPEIEAGDVDPIKPTTLPPNHFNTVQAKLHMGKDKDYIICGTVVSTRKSRKGNILMNLDKQFPNQIFTLFIRKNEIINFGYNPLITLKDQKVCATGKIIKLGDTPAMFINNEKQINIGSPKQNTLRSAQ